MSEQRFEDKGFLERGGPAASDAAPGKVREEDKSVDGPHARRAEPLEEGDKPDQLEGQQAENRQEALIDEAVEESFPASDPVSAKRIT